MRVNGWLVRLLWERALRLALLLPLAAICLFTLVSLAPLDPIRAFVGARMALIGPEQQAQIAEVWGLNEPPTQRFLLWAGQVLQGDFGDSMAYNAPVLQVIAANFPPTLVLLVVAFVLALVLGMAAGMAAAVWRGRWPDRLIRTGAVIVAASPGFWIAILLIAVFAVALGWLPACCAMSPGRLASESALGDRLRHMILPVLALSVVNMPSVILISRQKLIGFLEGPAAAHLRVHGYSDLGIARGPGLRHTLGTALAVHLASAGELFGGAVLIETAFALQGMGQATARAALGGDVPLLLGIGLATLIFVFIGNTLADVAAGLLDHRQRSGYRS
ncbi:ABC transporter permease [Paracoccus sp. (in: a-proteobacteria)]|uniref:ABC transporter permease n=1 Tax=Paracoccus sp. TaxID=267 RepID=UPI00391725E3